MSYTVLARKWRPKNFDQLVGQSHVMQALSNALDQNRLHHAYLFTGTRGVGKTTIARIFAKALNCEQGITSKPCGHCQACRAIDEGSFIDLIEVDAASKTKVDDTREILDNVQFAATQGRFKVYLIDEVHMLSKSSFNALLKTLEEPPEHVKFILATTDPHKLPVTVLSRCLQFNLMRLTEVQIQSHLAFVLDQEQISYEAAALALLAKSADGSVRDALSLLDQAIAYGAGKIEFIPVQTMLGLVDQQFISRILHALADEQAGEIKQLMGELSVMGVDYQALLSQLIEGLHVICYQQLFGELQSSSSIPEEVVQELALTLSPEQVQMLYQIALMAKQDMLLAPDIRIGFEMGLMRMLAFTPSDLSMEKESPIEVASVPKNNAAGFNPGEMNSVNEPAMIKDMPLNDAMAHLSSARSLVDQKTKKKLNNIEPGDPIVESVPHRASVAIGQEGRLNQNAEEPQSMSEVSQEIDHFAELSSRLASISELPDENPKDDSAGLSKSAQEPLSVLEAPEVVVQDRVAVASSFEEPAEKLEKDDLEQLFSVSPQESQKVSPGLESVSDQSLEKQGFNDLQIGEINSEAERAGMDQGQAPVLWQEWIESMKLTGMLREVAMNSVLVQMSNGYGLALIPEQDFPHVEPVKVELMQKLQQFVGEAVNWISWQDRSHLLTPAQYTQQQSEEKFRQAKASLSNDFGIQSIIHRLDMQLLEQTFKVR